MFGRNKPRYDVVTVQTESTPFHSSNVVTGDIAAKQGSAQPAQDSKKAATAAAGRPSEVVFGEYVASHLLHTCVTHPVSGWCVLVTFDSRASVCQKTPTPSRPACGSWTRLDPKTHQKSHSTSFASYFRAA